MSTPSLSSLYNLDKFSISMVLKINKKKLRALADKGRKSETKNIEGTPQRMHN